MASNTIDLGELQNRLQSKRKQYDSAKTRAHNAKAALWRAEDKLRTIVDEYNTLRVKIDDACRELVTK